jgi:hypothetical protein
MSLTPVFQGEVQFRRWSDSSTQGVQVTFALPDSEALEPLKHKAGKRFMAVLVEIGDDELPVPPQPRKDTRGPLCREACDYCAMPEFHIFVATAQGIEAAGADHAKEFIVGRCGVTSRKDLDTVATAAEKFRTLIRGPFMRWQRATRTR